MRARDIRRAADSRIPRRGLRRRSALIASSLLLALLVVTAAWSGDPAFVPGAPIPLGGPSIWIATADFNGDAKTDIVAESREGKIAILLGSGSGRFAEATGSPVAAGAGPCAVAVADVDGDGNADLAVANSSSRDVSILLGDGAGGFSAAPGSPIWINSQEPLGVTAADLNADGDVDLAVPTWPDRVVILLGNGAGGFTPAPEQSVQVGSHPYSVAVADFNGDRKVDLAVPNGESRELSILLGDGVGGFGLASSVPVPMGPRSLAVADLNRDGNPDLGVASQYSRDATILLGDGLGSFTASHFAVGRMATSIVVADFDTDGKPDVAVASPGSNGVTVRLGDGTGVFREVADSPFAGPSPWSLAAAELNGDGRIDLAVAEAGKIELLLQTPSTPTVVRGRTPKGHRPDSVLATRGEITKLAIDGQRAAVMTTKIKGVCGRIVVWAPPGRKTTRFASTKSCGLCGAERCVDALALGDGHVAWITRAGGNNLDLGVSVAKVSGGKSRGIDWVENGDGAGGDPNGGWVGELVGGGPWLGYDNWEVCFPDHPGSDCQPGDPETGRKNEQLVRISAGHRVVVKRGADAYRLAAAGGGRIAVETQGAIVVRTPRGSPLATIPAVDGNPPRAVALSQTRLAVERTFTLDLYAPARGVKTKSIPLGPVATLTLSGVNANVALLAGAHRLVLVRLGDGKLISFPLGARPPAIVGARLDGAGLFYAYNPPKTSAKGRVVFEPTAKLLARF
jgi:VCBS repeat protein